MIFLVEYNRKKGELVSFRTYVDADRHVAQDERLRMEIDQIGTGTENEIVILEAASEQALRKTHRRYFETLTELATIQ